MASAKKKNTFPLPLLLAKAKVYVGGPPPYLRSRLSPSRSHKNQTSMPFVHITWLPKACRSPAVRKEVSDAVMKAMINCKSADISPDNLVVRFSEAVDGFPLPKGHSNNPDLQAPQVPGAEAFLKDR